ncbi:MAG: tRNA (guanine26-N2/guanine27-N2)-dimethyltransferase [Candidatus Woesearchaeota archaeon]|nr:tRNA (guanine26-N2/guanine27-N2)-dimethyltransferase [Candidatus Woesearchaeota archaeon]MDN5327401.1 tRNA (guanine26-N2/guanine27-N2)-dimethyltransferase [Candidatus Woesearchaeota archaeon]
MKKDVSSENLKSNLTNLKSLKSISNNSRNSIESEQGSLTLSLIEEGKVKIYSYFGKISKKLPVFYNPIMKDNRTLTILVLKALGKNRLKIALPLAASGIRGIRILKELPSEYVDGIFFNDLNPKALEIINRNLELNNIRLLSEKIKLSNEDARLFLLKNKPFDYIDIDPFGTPNPFLDSAISSLKNNAILAVTATDTAPLCGTYKNACIRKYWSIPLHNYLMNEMGLRILIRKVQLVGLNYDFALLPIFSYAKDHYFRIFFKAVKSKQKATEIFNQHKELYFIDYQTLLSLDQKTLDQKTREKINSAKTGSKSNIFFVDNLFEFNPCLVGLLRNDKDKVKVIKFGPLWTGHLYDVEIVKTMLEHSQEYGESLQKFLKIILEEAKLNILGFYDIHILSKALKKNPPKKSELIKKLREESFLASETHFNSTAIKTNAALNEILKFF